MKKTKIQIKRASLSNYNFLKPRNLILFYHKLNKVTEE